MKKISVGNRKKSVRFFGVLVMACFSIAASVTIVFAVVGVNVDPFAKAQRAIMIIEQKIQTLQMVKNIKLAYDEYLATKEIFEQGKELVQRLQDPAEWEKLKKFALSREKALLTYEGNPENAKITQSLRNLNDALDSYIDRCIEYNVGMKALEDADAFIANSIGTPSGAPVSWGGISGVNVLATPDYVNAVAKNVRAADESRAIRQQMYRDMLAVSKKRAEGIESKLQAYQMQYEVLAGIQKNLDEAKKAQEEEELKLRNAAANESSREKTESLAKSLSTAESRRRYLAEKQAELDKQKKWLDDEVKAATEAWNANVNSLMDRMGKMNDIAGEASTLKYVQLSSMAKCIGMVELSRAIFFTLFSVVIAVTILLFAIRNQGFQSSLDWGDEFWGVVITLTLLAPFSPLNITALCETLVPVYDTMTGMFHRACGGPVAQIVSNWDNYTGAIAEDLELLEKDKEDLKSADNFLDRSVAAVKTTIRVFNFSLNSITANALRTLINMALSFLLSFIAKSLVYVALILRTVSFWLIMALGPMCIVMAPLKWGREKLLPGWGQALWAIFLFGPIIYIILGVFNLAVQDIMPLMTSTSSGWDMGTLGLGKATVNIIMSIVLSVFMIMSPKIAFDVASGSFGAVSSALSGALLGSAGAVAGLAMAGVGKAIPGAGKTMERLGNAVSSVGNGIGSISGNAGGGGMAGMWGGVAKGMQRAGGSIQAAGSRVRNFDAQPMVSAGLRGAVRGTRINDVVKFFKKDK